MTIRARGSALCFSDDFPGASIDTPGTERAILTVALCCLECQEVISVSGALNRDSLVALEVQINQIGGAGPLDVVLELSGLLRIDDTGVAAVSGLVDYVHARERRIEISGATGQVAAALLGAHLIEEAAR